MGELPQFWAALRFQIPEIMNTMSMSLEEEEEEILCAVKMGYALALPMLCLLLWLFS